MYRAPSSDYDAEDMTVLIIWAILGMDPLFGGSGESLDMNKFHPTLLLVFVSDR